MALHLRLESKTLRNLRIRRLSSSSAPPPHAPPPVSDSSGDDTSDAPPSAFSSYFSEIKERLKSPPSPPRRIPDNPPPPPPLTDSKPNAAASLEEIRKHLADFRRRSGVHPPASAQQSPPPTLSFQELFKKNAIGKGGDSNSHGTANKREPLSLDSIRESLRQFRGPRGSAGQPQNSFNLKLFQENLRNKVGDPQRNPSILGRVDAELPDSVFGRELREKEQEGGREPKGLKTKFLKTYSYDELGDKLRKLRPEVAAKGRNDWFSLSELNQRLAKLRELEETEAESRIGGISFKDLRDSLTKLQDDEDDRIANMQKLTLLVNIGGQATPTFMLKPPQEHLLEKYYHPDHMSSAEKMKLELKKVRDEFKTSESDCGSTRVQVAQLTTKIKHLSSTLHKKDKHSRKGLQEMVQRRKKLLKYLRRTDWDSYCLVLSRLGLRDVPEYKTPDYKS